MESGLARALVTKFNLQCISNILWWKQVRALVRHDVHHYRTKLTTNCWCQGPPAKYKWRQYRIFPFPRVGGTTNRWEAELWESPIFRQTVAELLTRNIFPPLSRRVTYPRKCPFRGIYSSCTWFKTIKKIVTLQILIALVSFDIGCIVFNVMLFCLPQARIALSSNRMILDVW